MPTLLILDIPRIFYINYTSSALARLKLLIHNIGYRWQLLLLLILFVEFSQACWIQHLCRHFRPIQLTEDLSLPCRFVQATTTGTFISRRLHNTVWFQLTVAVENIICVRFIFGVSQFVFSVVIDLWRVSHRRQHKHIRLVQLGLARLWTLRKILASVIGTTAS